MKMNLLSTIAPEHISDQMQAWAAGHEHFILVFDYESADVCEVIEQRYYRGADQQDFTLFSIAMNGLPMILCGARKRRMLANQFAGVLREHCGTTAAGLGEADILRAGFLAIVQPQNQIEAFAAIEYFMGSESVEPIT